MSEAIDNKRLRSRAGLLLGGFLGVTHVATAFAAQQGGASATPMTITVPTGSANVNITPRRIIFDRNKRAEAVYLFNQGTAAVTVDVTLVDNVMFSNGEIVPVSQTEAKEAVSRLRSASAYLLAVPSRLTLAPGQGKTVRVRALLPESDDAAEYRSHLTVTTVPPPDAGLTAEQAAAASQGELVLRVQTVFGLSIPLIVRTGGANATASLANLMPLTDEGKPVLALDIARSGVASLYGNLEARDAKGEVIGLVRGLGVYPEVSIRHVRIPLLRALRKGEPAAVTYKADDGATLASAQLTAP